MYGFVKNNFLGLRSINFNFISFLLEKFEIFNSWVIMS
jgi:hypothetical protein